MISDLKIELGDCVRTDCSNICSNQSSYEIINSPIAYIFDPPNIENLPCRLVNSNEVYNLTVKSLTTNGYIFIKVDKCLFHSLNIKRCDLILFNDFKFVFIEIKTGKAGNRGEKRKEAVEQLASTIDYFISKTISLENKKLFAQICFDSIKDYPIKTSFMSRRVLFEEKYKVQLVEGNLLEM